MKLVGAAYGTVWEIVGNKLVFVESGELMPLDLMGGEVLDEDCGETRLEETAGKEESSTAKDVETEDMGGAHRDNRALVDNNDSQALKMKDIVAMRKSGKGGADIIKALVSSSATFSDKTAFSQEKYLKKKALKYIRRFRVLRTNAHNITETLTTNSPGRIGGLRVDSLAALLNQGDVRAGGSVMVFDGVGGLLVGAVAERMSAPADYPSPGLSGQIIAAYDDSLRNNCPVYSLTQTFNSGRIPGAAEGLISVGYSELSHWAQDISKAAPPLPLQASSSSSEVSGGGSDAVKAVSFCVGKKRGREGAEGKSGGPPSVGDLVGNSPLQPYPYSIQVKQYLLGRGVDSLVMALGETPRKDGQEQQTPLALFLSALRYLRGSASFSVFSCYPLPLATLGQVLREQGLACNVRLAEIFTRELQVLPSRTHPHMAMHAASGFILSGTILLTRYSVVHYALRAPAPRKAAPKKGVCVAAAASAVTAPLTTSPPHDSQMPPRDKIITTDTQAMLLACTEAAKCTPSPGAYSVGALVLCKGVVLSSGFSRELPGNTHAEEVALGKLTLPLPPFSTLYTTMEPCSRRLSGKDPCTSRILQAGVPRVVYCLREPTNFVEDCVGVEELQRAGVETVLLEDAECRRLAGAPNSHLSNQLA